MATMRHKSALVVFNIGWKCSLPFSFNCRNEFSLLVPSLLTKQQFPINYSGLSNVDKNNE